LARDGKASRPRSPCNRRYESRDYVPSRGHRSPRHDLYPSRAI